MPAAQNSLPPGCSKEPRAARLPPEISLGLFHLSPTGVAHLSVDVALLDVLVAQLGKLSVAHLLPRNHPHCKPRLTPHHQPMAAQTKDTFTNY